LNLAIENGLGFISITNIREEIIYGIDKPKLKIPINLKQLNFQSVIEYKNR